MISVREVEVWLLELTEDALEKLLEYLIQASLQLEVQIHKLHRLVFKLKELPSFNQYANRLIEYFDSPIVLEAYNRLEALVRAGIAPDHAFRMITQPGQAS